MTCRQAESTHGDIATQSIKRELRQLLQKGFADPIMPKDLTEEDVKAAITSKMFVKEKLKPDGTVNKIKSRLVARGDKQERELYVGKNLSATTADSISVFTILAIAELSDIRTVYFGDVGGAYLNASMGKNFPKVLPAETQSRCNAQHQPFTSAETGSFGTTKSHLVSLSFNSLN